MSRVGQWSKPLQQVGRYGLTGKIPDDGTQFGVNMKTQTMIDSEEMIIIRPEEEMRTLAVGVVGEQIKKSQRKQNFALIGGEIEEMTLGVMLDEELQRAGTKGRVRAQDGGRHQVERQGAGKQVSGGLALGEGAIRKVPQPTLPLLGFVNRLEGLTSLFRTDQKGGVGAVGEPSERGELAVSENFLDLRIG